MKNLTQLSIIALLILNMSVAHAQKSADARNLKTLLASEKLSTDDIDKAYNTLDQLVDHKTGMTMKDLLELCVLYSKHDVSDAAHDFASSLKKSNLKEFESALKELSKEDRSKILEFIKLSESEEKSGNG